MARPRGLAVHSVDFEHWLYGIKAHDPKSARWFELFMNPRTGELPRGAKTGKPVVDILAP